MTLVYGNIRFMRIFAGVPWRGGVKRQFANANALNDFCDVELVLVSIGLIGLVLRSSLKMLLMLFSAAF